MKTKARKQTGMLYYYYFLVIIDRDHGTAANEATAIYLASG